MDEIYVVDPSTKKAVVNQRVSFSDIGIHERYDLQEWVLSHPGILGEPLFIITSEFAGFDKSSRRLDLLALDPEGNLVVIELKLDIQRSAADLQALRYAAFCSTMTTAQVIEEYARFRKITTDEAETQIAEFLGMEEVPEPSDRPRIILLAGLMDDPELTSTVLWLRNFEIDIKCLEVAPYHVDGRVLLVPRMVIPLPEIERYMVRVEQKEASRAKREAAPSNRAELFRGIIDEFAHLETPLKITSAPRRQYLQVRTGNRDVHYEWIAKERVGELHVALHFESGEREENLKRLQALRAIQARVTAGVETPFRAEEWGRKWCSAAFIMPLKDDPATRAEAARLMSLLMDRTWPEIAAATT